MLYALYSAKGYGGWLGLLICTSLAFISSDLVFYFLHSNTEEDKFSKSKAEYSSSSQPKNFRGRPSEGSMPYAETFQANVDASMGASTSGTNEGDPLSAEEEVARVLGCKDHYGVLGFARFDIFDVSILKREYKKKVRNCYFLHLNLTPHSKLGDLFWCLCFYSFSA